jgi:hypothetical protein
LGFLLNRTGERFLAEFIPSPAEERDSVATPSNRLGVMLIIIKAKYPLLGDLQENGFFACGSE